MDQTLVNRVTNFLGSSLIPLAGASLDHFALPEETSVFLQSCGLPLELEDGLLLHFYTEAEALAVYTDRQERFLIIGDDYGTRLGIKENTGEIFSIDPDGILPTRLVNSSILVLLAFLETYAKEQPALVEASEEEASRIVARLRDEWQTLDAIALDDPESWWSVVLEQTEHALL